jgi:aspartate racemase
MENKNKIIGILGGMGPAATADLLSKIIELTPAKRDSDHLRIIIDNNPQIPDRTAAILGKGKNPVEELIKTAKNLEKAGANLIAVPCISFHYFYGQVQEKVNPPIINVIFEVAKYIKEEFPKLKRLGLMATKGTIEGQLFQKYLLDTEILVPAEMDKVMEAIYEIKGGAVEVPRRKLLNIAKDLATNGAEAILGGCTEIPLVLKEEDLHFPFIDPIQILARVVIKEASS